MRACSRISIKNPHNFDTIQPLYLESSEKDVLASIRKFIHQQGYSKAWIQNLNGCYIYSVFVSTFWGFLDDFGVDFFLYFLIYVFKFADYETLNPYFIYCVFY